MEESKLPWERKQTPKLTTTNIQEAPGSRLFDQQTFTDLKIPGTIRKGREISESKSRTL